MNTRGQGLDDNAPQSPRRKGKNYLFAIAIDRYRYSPPLYNCVRDAEQIIALLQKKYQFEPDHTITLYNETATEKNIFDTFKKLVKTLTPEDNLLILYSGHGEFETDIEEGYWIPVDAQLGDFSDYVSNSRIVKYLRAIDAHHILMIVDSCFSGTLFAHRNAGSEHSSAFRLDEIPSRWLLTAGRSEVVSDGKPGDHSPFADNILYFLENNSYDSLSIADLSDSVIDAVIYNSRQTPRGEPLQDVGHRGGQFYFHRKGHVPVAPVEDNPVKTHTHTETPPTTTTTEERTGKTSSGGGGFWILAVILVAVVAAIMVAGSLFKPEAEAVTELEYEPEELSSEDYTGSTETTPVEVPPVTEPNQETNNRMQQAWTAVRNMDTEEAYRRFIDRFPKSRLANEAEKRIAAMYRYELMFSPSIKGAQELSVNFSTGKPPFHIRMIPPNGEALEKTWNSRDQFFIDLGKMEATGDGVSVLKVIVTDYNFKKAGHVLPVY
ncbi:caspase family protein [Flavilitoribacter nigricans]|uniref:Peptidase C14 caspase domain-containing protein n=1 Tax=Flavilitoribacter nigricans (strain ATCC 23147 / DSM 23189 / NBRC 102662 / NCIMB 1420 / SS-2) TaxID=1122177 RepID=A0A2D0N643_FLAN2|nr:caspase family protein [Flavilitoribacter nigricans]PHN03981.1 hypothetical protein CRP01_24225 [Flavilitoribacter nigricans DSM 23189 = NBRC 102662]